MTHSTGYITMDGKCLSVSKDQSDTDTEVIFSECEEDMRSGQIKFILGHAESWASSRGQTLLKYLVQKRMIGGIFIDECHMNLGKLNVLFSSILYMPPLI